MKVIYKLKEWYTLQEASARFSEVFSESITVEHILEFAGTGKIDLFLHLTHHAAVGCEYYQKPTNVDGKNRIANSPYKNADAETVDFVKGNLKLSIRTNVELQGYFRAAIRHIEQSYSLAEFEYEEVPFDDLVVEDEDHKFWQLMHELDGEQFQKQDIPNDTPWNSIKRYSGRYKWPYLSELGIIKSEIERFEAYIGNPTNEELLPKERNTLLKLIIGMAKDAYGFDPTASRSPFPKELEGILDGLGISVSDDTIRKWLKEAADHLPPDNDTN